MKVNGPSFTNRYQMLYQGKRQIKTKQSDEAFLHKTLCDMTYYQRFLVILYTWALTIPFVLKLTMQNIQVPTAKISLHCF